MSAARAINRVAMRARGSSELHTMPPSGRDTIAAARHFHRVLRRRLNGSLMGLAMSYAQYEILELLHAESNLHAAELARSLGLSRQAVNHLVTQLELRGLVEVLPKEGGLRVMWISHLGTRRLATCRLSLEQAERALERLSPDTRSMLVEAFGEARAALAPPPGPWWFD